MSDRRIRVFGGKLLDPFDPDPADLLPSNFVHSSSLVNRYAGNTKYPYSIGQHSSVLSVYVPMQLRRAALIHDWAECWFQDMPQPIKMQLPNYKAYEHQAMLDIGKRFGVSAGEYEDLDPYDKSIYIDERNVLMNRLDDGGMGDDRVGLGVKALWFEERDWRKQREITENLFRYLFPEVEYV